MSDRGRRSLLLGLVCAAIAGTTGYYAPSAAGSPFRYDVEYPSIGYSTKLADNPVTRLAQHVKDGDVQLQFRPERGYLDSLIEALGISPSSQVLVFSKTSLQKSFISAATPRAIYFNGDTYVAWVQGSNSVELVTTDPAFGPVFYTFHNERNPRPDFQRQNGRCLVCHDSYGMMGGGTPQLLAGSKITDVDGDVLIPVTDNTVDQTPVKKRWGGWYVTGRSGAQTHLGNILVRSKSDLARLDTAKRLNLDTLKGLGVLNIKPYLTTKSDIVALMVLEHQITVQNQITYVKFKAPNVLKRIGQSEAINAASWDALPPMARKALAGMLDRLVRRLMFVDTAQFGDRIEGTAGFEAWFQAQGPRDKSGRSLRTLDLRKQLFKYAVSYLIYSSEFASLPAYAKDYVYMKIAAVLEGRDRSKPYRHLSKADRRATLEILTSTKPNFVAYCQSHKRLAAH